MGGERRSESWLRVISRAAWTGRWALFTGLAATMVPAVALTLLHDQPYRAEAQMVIRQLPSDLANDTTPIDPQRRLENEIAVLEGDEVAARVRTTLGIAGVVPPVDGFTNGTADVVVARVDSKIAGLAAELANAYVESYIAVQAERLSTGLRSAISDLQAQLDSLQAQISALPSDDPKLATMLAQKTLDLSTVEKLQVDLAVAEQPAEVVAPAAVPSDPMTPSLLRPLLLSVLIGLVLGGIGAVLMSRGRKEVRIPDDLTLRSTEPVLAVVPIDVSTNATPIVIRQPSGRSVDAYIPLRAALLRLAKDRNVRVVQFCSPNDGDGTTTTAVNAALMLARTNLVRVALVDLNMRAPRVHTMLGLEAAPGVTDALDEEADAHHTNALDRLERLGRVGIGVGDELAALDSLGGLAFVGLDDTEARPLSIPTSIIDKDLAVVTSGTRPRSALEVLSRRRMDDLMDDLRSTYDIIIIDSPAVLSSGDAVTIGRHADGVVLVVRAGTVTMGEVRQSLATVERSGTRILGVVLTGAQA
jgi:succinoglycan biosynthesis transport protein ExoP